jgi:hypothetical protein
MAYTFRPNADGPVYVDVGDKLQFEYRAPSLYGLTETVTIYIGQASFTWAISVPPAEFSPAPFSFKQVNPAELDTAYYYADGSRDGEEVVTISGLTEGVTSPITITANLVANVNNYGIKINNSPNYILTDGSQTVQNGDTFTIFAKSQPNNAAETKVVVSIGSTSGTWTITNKQIAENKPEPAPNFEDKNSEELNTMVYSEPVQILGLSSPAAVSLSTSTAGVTPQFAISSSNSTTENSDGYNVLNGATFGTTGTISNGQYLQLRVTSSSTPNDPIVVNLSIGDGSGIDSWQVRTNSGSSKEPNQFIFSDVTGIQPSTVVEAVMRDPSTGNPTSISGIDEPVPVTLVSATAGTTPQIRIGSTGSIGSFSNVFVDNGDVIYLYNTSSAAENGTVETTIQVGTRTIGTWTIQTAGPPITTPVFSQPPNLTGQNANEYVSSALIALTAVNTPIQLTATNGALISIDSDAPVAGPRTFDPSVNSFVSISLLTNNSYGSPAKSTLVTFGTATPFTWSVQTAVSAPVISNIVGTWYSKKNDKYEGYAIGTVLQVLKESTNSYGNIETRFPGFIECDGRALNTFQYRFLHAIISNIYGGTAYDAGVTDQQGVTTTFNVPDYRNKRVCGTGVVDGNSGSSRFLPISSGGSNSQVGETGGWWYVDKVDVSGGDPFQQVTAPSASANTGTESPFFTLGTIRTFGTENIEGEANFEIAASSKVDATIAGLTEVFVNVPPHEHQFLTTAVEADSGEGVIPWETRAYYFTAETFNSPNLIGPDKDESPDVADWIRGKYTSYLGGDFASEVSLTGLTLDDINFPTTEASSSQPFGNYWYSDFNELDLNFHQNVSGVATIQSAGVIDTTDVTGSITTYTSPGTLKSHSHVLGLTEYTSVDQDFTYGNVSGTGTFLGLGGYSDAIQVTFNQSDVLVGLNEAEFTFSNTKRPSPTFYMEPQRTVPIINNFHKVKYIIKAY